VFDIPSSTMIRRIAALAIIIFATSAACASFEAWRESLPERTAAAQDCSKPVDPLRGKLRCR